MGHHLDPRVFVGKNEITEAVLDELNDALTRNELVKVRLQDSVSDRKSAARRLAEATGAELVQVLGRTLLLFRRNEEEPKIELPG